MFNPDYTAIHREYYYHCQFLKTFKFSIEYVCIINYNPNMKNNIRISLAFTGLLVTVIGVLLFLNKLGTQFPWPMLLMVIGAFNFIKNGFKRAGGLLVFLIGAAFMTQHLYPSFLVREYLLPGVLILVGIALIFKSFRPRNENWLKFRSKCEKAKIKFSK